ncbi:MAG: cation diffusion facilitator family transporter [Elainellaceae cyanobacterium]
MHNHCPECDRHTPGSNADSSAKNRVLWTALILIGGFAAGEFAMGIISHSLALVAESGHMVSDSIVLGIALLASWIARFPASNNATFGYRRVEILAALANGIGLIGVAGWLGWEAIARLHEPHLEILSVPMLITALVGLGVNGINVWLLHGHSHHDLNVRGAFLHMMADVMSSIGVILAAIAVWAFDWIWADRVASIAVAVVIAVAAVPLIRESLHVLLEKTPTHLNLSEIQAHLENFEGVLTAYNIRLWAIAPGQETLSAALAVTLSEGQARDQLLQHIQVSLQQEFGLHDVVVQMSSPVWSKPINLSEHRLFEHGHSDS